MKAYKDSKIKSLIRILMISAMSKRIPLYVVSEFPKSGGTWFCRMLSEAIGAEFPTNGRLPSFKCPSIIHGHYKRIPGMSQPIIIWRDGRDVMVSWYHHCLFKNEYRNALLVEETRKHFRPLHPYEDVKANMAEFIMYCFEKQRYPRFTWAEFVDHWLKCSDAIYVKYEDLLKNARKVLTRVIHDLGITCYDERRIEKIVFKYSFANLAGRKAGEERKNSFYRKGIAGDWKNYFGEDARHLFDQYAGEQLIKLGYEKDHEWVSFG